MGRGFGDGLVELAVLVLLHLSVRHLLEHGDGGLEVALVYFVCHLDCSRWSR